MPGQNLIQSVGGGAQKQTHFVSIYTSRWISGLYTNRSLLRGPLDSLYTDFYHMGTTDVLCDGLNSEISARSTMIRRPGNPPYSSASTLDAIDSFYAFHKSDGTISVIADSLSDVEVVTPTTITSIFTKSSGAGQGYFQGVDKTLYIADGVDLVKYIPGTNNPTTNTPIWNLGGVAPTQAPTLTITQTGSAVGVPWQALSVYSTMGFLVDSNGNVQQLFSVNATGTNNTRYGTTSNGEPNWNLTPGTTTSDGTVTWTNFGPVSLWTSLTLYQDFSLGGFAGSPCMIYDPASNTFQGNSNPGFAAGTSGSSKPHFTGVNFVFTYDPVSGGHPPGVKWFSIVPGTVIGKWKPNTLYNSWLSGTSNNRAVLVPYILPPPPNQTVYLMTSNGGTSGAGGTAPIWNTVTGAQTVDNDLIWVCQGSATRQTNHAYSQWVPGQLTFSVFKDPNNNMQVCTTSGTSSGTATGSITWGTGYGNTTPDGTVVWTCVGPFMSWAVNTIWHLPQSGFAPPSASQPYGGASVVDTNNVNQFVISSGKSGASAPSWSAVGSNTTDSGITWYALSSFTAAGFSWTKGMGYVYSFKARRASDVFVLNSPPLQIPGTNSPNPVGPLGPPTGAGDGSVTTASPVTQIAGANNGAQVKISGSGTTDPQFDTVEIYRSADGFASSGPYLFLTDIPMPPPVGNQPGVWSIVDFMPDKATSLLPGLNPLIEAPIGNFNDPPPGQFGSTQFQAKSAAEPTVAAAGSAIIGLVYHQGRMWGFIGNTVFVSGGPDTIPGNGFTAWPPDQAFPFQSNVTRLLPTTAGLLVFTTTDLAFIGGGPGIADYYSQLIVPGLGLLSWNALTILGGIPYLFASDRQFISIDMSSGVTRVGHPIGDKLAQFDPTTAYVTYHSYGDLDHALFISDGSSQWYRCDISPAPDGRYTGPVWNPKAMIAGGFKALASIETSPGVRQLLIGPPSVGKILARDSTFTSFVDNVSSYDSYFVMGNITLAHAGQMGQLNFVDMDFIKTGSQPSIFVLFDEIAPSVNVPFEKISNVFISDPPKLYGPSAVPNTIWSNRYYFGQTTPGNTNTEPIPAWCKSLQLKVDFGNDTIQNELLAFTLYVALWQEK